MSYTQRLTKGSVRRSLALSATGAMILALAPISSATAAVSDICPAPGSAGTDNFADDNGNTHEANINCAADYGIVNGTTAVTFDPGGDLTRGQAASLLVQWAEKALGAALTTNGTDEFSDTAGTTHEANIDKAADNGLVQGFSDGTYRPNETISRDQFASIAVNATEFVLGSALTADATDDFSDDDGNVHEANIEKAVDNGILNGATATTFAPKDDVTRGQTATIAIQAAGNVLFPANKWAPVPNPSTNQTFEVTPTDAATQDVASTRQYSAAVPAGTVVDIRLFDAADVTVDADGVVTFKDAGGDNLADENVNAARITVVNGVSQTPAQEINDVASTGTVTFSITSATPADVIPVVWADPTVANGGNDQLNLAVPTVSNTDPKAPSEDFGIGGEAIFVPTEAALGAHTANDVASANTAADYFIGGDDNETHAANSETFYYDANDTYQYQGVGVTMAQFEGLLSATDVLTIAYNPDPAGVSSFNVTTDNVAPATAAKATVSDADGDTVLDDVTVEWTASTQADAVYDVYRDNNTANDTADAAELVSNNVTGTSVALTSEPTGTYNYIVIAQGATSGASSTPALTADVVVPGTASANAAPTAADSIVTSNGGFTGTFDAGDVFKVVFSEAIAAPDSGDTIRANDGADGTVADFINGTNATFTRNAAAETVNGLSRAANTVLTVTLTTSPSVVTAGTTAGLQIPGTIADQSGTTDLAGKAWDVSTGDLLIDQDSADNTTGADVTTTGISPSSGPTAGGTAVTITGTNFTTDGTTTVTIGGVAATGVTVVNSTTITATTPAGTLGAKDVVVTSGGDSGTLTGGYTYV